MNLKKFGIKTYDADVLSMVNQYLEKYTQKTLERTMRKYKNLELVEASHIQTGGRIVLPLEYFGVSSGSYFADQANNGTNMSVTNAAIRPVVATYDLSGAIKSGGASKKEKDEEGFVVSQKVLQDALSEAKVSLQRNVRLSKDAVSVMRQGFQQMMTEIMKKANKSQHLTRDDLSKVASQRKYQKFLE